MVPRRHGSSSLAVVAAAAVAAAALLEAAPARALDRYLDVPDAAFVERSPAFRYANMADADVIAELDRRGLPYVRVDAASAPGVRTPVRLAGRLHGVHVHSSLPEAQRATTPFEILDGRLALALDDFCAILERHDIDEVVHYTMYRPNVPQAAPPVAAAPHPTLARAHAGLPRPAARPTPIAAKAPPAQVPQIHEHDFVEEPILAPPPRSRATSKVKPGSKKARGLELVREKKQKAGGDDAKPVRVITAAKAAPAVATRWKRPGTTAASSVAKTGPQHAGPAAPGTRHPAGLAIDVGVLHKKDGRWISVGSSFHGHIGDKTCGAGAASPEDPNARELRSIVCEARDAGVFTYVLTPNYNADHVDHFHMEVKSGVRWFLYH